MTPARSTKIVALVGVLTFLPFAHAGGPRYVAGNAPFNPNVKGTPITWAQGNISYYTDQGDLSPILQSGTADAFVADAFSRWTAISTAAVTATRTGQLAEDVSGANVTPNGDGTFTMPADIQPSAVAEPVGIVYDADGAVTNALLGQGAGDESLCFSNAAFGGADNFSPDAHFLHALVVINGVCALGPAQLPDVKYRLVRVLGHVLGLDWSQLNLNVITGNPPPTADDKAGFPVMHALDPQFCLPVAGCYPNADQPKLDDEAALSRLYPVTTQNQSSFPSKQLFFENTFRVHGSVSFRDANGGPGQPMQAVNVVARWIDPTTQKPSRSYAISSVSGNLFRGNAGNPASGFNDSTGQSFDRFGTDDALSEGSFDLAGLNVPNGATTAQFQINVEAIDPQWSVGVGPYSGAPVQPSGTFQPVIVSVNLGGDVQQDILMQGSALAVADWFGPTTYAAPAPLPPPGDWLGSLSGYGDQDYFWFNAQAGRTLSVEAMALDETGTPSQGKSEPVIGMWALEDPGTFPAPANTPSAFNSLTFGMTKLDAVLFQSTSFRIGIVDYRGDGRPDYRYHARVFYGDTATPARISVAGGTPLTVKGLGFRSNTSAAVSNRNGVLLSASANAVLFSSPAVADGVYDLALSDPLTRAGSTLTGVLTAGAGPDDIIKLIAGSNPGTPVGGQAPNPVVVQALAADGVTPVAGASIAYSAAPAVGFSACGGATSCTVFTDQGGLALSKMTVLSAGASNITVQLAPASYNPAKFVQTTLLGTSSSLDISLLSPFAWIAQGATVDVALTARVLSSGTPLAGQTVNYQVLKGTATLGSSNAITDANGLATVNLHVPGMISDVLVSACVGATNKRCQNFSALSVPLASLKLQAVSGTTQEVLVGQAFQPVALRVINSSTPPNPVLGAGVAFQTIVARVQGDIPILWMGDTDISDNPLIVILGSSQTSLTSDLNGMVSLAPSSSGFQGALLLVGAGSVGTSAQTFELQSLWPLGQ